MLTLVTSGCTSKLVTSNATAAEISDYTGFSVSVYDDPQS